MSSNAAGDMQDTRPGLAIVAPTQERYRHALHRRIIDEIPEFKLHSIYTHALGAADRAKRDESDINAVFFDTGEPTTARHRPANQLRNIVRGKKIFQYFTKNNIRAAIILGYNDLGLLSLMTRAHRAGITLFLWGDSNAAGDHATGLVKAAKERIIQYAGKRSSIVFSCGSLGEKFFQNYGIDREKIRYCPYEPDYELIESLSDRTIEAVRATHNLAEHRKRFVFCGRMVENKRPDLALSSFIQIAQSRPEWDILLVGDGPERGRLEAMVPPDLKDRVLFTGFLDDQDAVSAIYRLSEVLVHPCDFEPWGLIINEAAAAGLAIITTTSCGAGVELVDHGTSGFLLPPGDPEALTEAMLQISEPEAIASFRARSREMLQLWRQKADPVRAIRRSLRDAGLMPDPTTKSGTP